MSSVQSVDIVVAGNGPAGMAAAISLAQAGFEVAIAAPAQMRVDQRTTALMMPSIRFLDSLGVFEPLAPLHRASARHAHC